jgi:hypothetical protein
MEKEFKALRPVLDERARRLWAATEARALGQGGISAVARARGLSSPTIRAGIGEIGRGAVGRSGTSWPRGSPGSLSMEWAPGVCGQGSDPWLTIEWVLSQFSPRMSIAQQRYQAFVRAGMGQGYREEFTAEVKIPGCWAVTVLSSTSSGSEENSAP